MRQILCVIDFTESAGKVLGVAARIASACKAHLVILFAYRLYINGYQGDIHSMKRKLETEAKEKFDALVTPLRHENLSYEFLSEIGFIPDRIEAHAKRNHTDMIVIGQQQTVASHDGKHFNLQRLIANSKLPFVIVPTEVSAEASIQKEQ